MSYKKDNHYRNYDDRRDRRYNNTHRQPPKEGKRPSHVSIQPKGNEPIEKTIKRFLRKVKKSGIADDFRKGRYYEKPSVKKRRDKMRREAVLRKLKMKQAKQNR